MNMQFEDFKDDFEVACEIETPFVGREDDLKQLDDVWLTKKIFGVFGIRAVGKSRLVKEFIERKCSRIISRSDSVDKTTTENGSDRSKDLEAKREEIFKVISIDMVLQGNIDTLYAYLCATLDIQPEPNATDTAKWKKQIVECIKIRNQFFIICFDNAENVVEGELHDKVLSLCLMLVKESQAKVKIFFTSTTTIQFSQIKVYCSHELLPLKPHETRVLLKAVAPNVDLGYYENYIVMLSEGLPLLILMIGSELEDDGGLITPAEMVEMLSTFRLRALSREFYPEEDRVADVYRKFIERLKKVHQNRLSVLEYIPGSFNIAEARELLGYDTDALTKDQVVIPLRRRHVLNYDHAKQRFLIQGILKECLQVYFKISNVPEIRKRYCKIFSCVMKEIAKALGTAEYTKALSEFTTEQPNLQKLLTEVYHSKEECYPFFIEIAGQCTELIERFLMSESEKFYDGCLKLATQYKQDNDIAVVHIAVGSMATNLKGDLPRGARNYEAALRVLLKQGKSIQLATVYQRMGWNLHRQGKNVDAVGYFVKSLAISSKSGNQAQLLALQSSNSLGVTHTVLGNFDGAEMYHFQSLKRRKVIQGENHPAVGVTLNNIGVFYDQKGEHGKALEYFLKGLEIKRKGNLPPTTLAYSLNNIAAQYSSVKQWEKAHTLLDEAMTLLSEQDVPPKDALGLTHDTRGKVLMAERRYEEASEMFENAVAIRKNLIPRGLTYFESLMHLAKVKQCQGDYKASLKINNKVLKLKDDVIKTMPQNTFITECLECLADLYQAMKDDEQYMGTLEKIQTELMRLEKFQLCQCNEKKVERIRQQLQDLNMKINNMRT